MDALNAITLVSALVGTVTGIGGLWVALANRRHLLRTSAPKLRVIPELAFPGPLDEMVNQTFFNDSVEHALESLKTFACATLTNTGAKELTVFEVGFKNAEAQIPWRSPDCIWINPNDEWRDSSYVDKLQPFPLTIPPDQTISIYIRVWPRRENSMHSQMYAKIDSGEVFVGSSPILSDTIAWLNDTAKNAA